MTIRESQPQDVSSLVALDHAAYGNYGADQSYFEQKLRSTKAKIIVSERNNKITGFVVFEVMEPGKKLDGFTELNVSKPIAEKWMHIIAFTTATNFKDVQADTLFLQAAEHKARGFGCTQFCVPLSVDHPYAKNDVFGFWEKNGYKKFGTVKWIASPTETIDCFFYTKSAENRF